MERMETEQGDGETSGYSKNPAGVAIHIMEQKQKHKVELEHVRALADSRAGIHLHKGLVLMFNHSNITEQVVSHENSELHLMMTALCFLSECHVPGETSPLINLYKEGRFSVQTNSSHYLLYYEIVTKIISEIETKNKRYKKVLQKIKKDVQLPKILLEEKEHFERWHQDIKSSPILRLFAIAQKIDANPIEGEPQIVTDVSESEYKRLRDFATNNPQDDLPPNDSLSSRFNYHVGLDFKLPHKLFFQEGGPDETGMTKSLRMMSIIVTMCRHIPYVDNDPLVSISMSTSPFFKLPHIAHFLVFCLRIEWHLISGGYPVGWPNVIEDDGFFGKDVLEKSFIKEGLDVYCRKLYAFRYFASIYASGHCENLMDRVGKILVSDEIAVIIPRRFYGTVPWISIKLSPFTRACLFTIKDVNTKDSSKNVILLADQDALNEEIKKHLLTYFSERRVSINVALSKAKKACLFADHKVNNLNVLNDNERDIHDKALAEFGSFMDKFRESVLDVIDGVMVFGNMEKEIEPLIKAAAATTTEEAFIPGQKASLLISSQPVLEDEELVRGLDRELEVSDDEEEEEEIENINADFVKVDLNETIEK